MGGFGFGGSYSLALKRKTLNFVDAGSCGRHFDVGSFFGGAALAAGISVIIFFGCKFYKARSMPSYHQF